MRLTPQRGSEELERGGRFVAGAFGAEDVLLARDVVLARQELRRERLGNSVVTAWMGIASMVRRGRRWKTFVIAARLGKGLRIEGISVDLNAEEVEANVLMLRCLTAW